MNVYRSKIDSFNSLRSLTNSPKQKTLISWNQKHHTILHPKHNPRNPNLKDSNFPIQEQKQQLTRYPGNKTQPMISKNMSWTLPRHPWPRTTQRTGTRTTNEQSIHRIRKLNFREPYTTKARWVLETDQEGIERSQKRVFCENFKAESWRKREKRESFFFGCPCQRTIFTD